MGKGSYIGGSTVIRVHSTKGRPRTRGLLALEVQFERTGSVPQQSLMPAAAKKKKKKKRPDAPPSEKQRQASARGIPPTHSNKTNTSTSSASSPRSPPAQTHPPGGLKAQYSADEIQAYLIQHHPKCPRSARERIAKLAAQGRWTGMTPAAVIASCMEHYLSYQVCGLQKLIDFGLDRRRAAELVGSQVKTVMALWGSQPVWANKPMRT